jgi:hypothetical protein
MLLLLENHTNPPNIVKLQEKGLCRILTAVLYYNIQHSSQVSILYSKFLYNNIWVVGQAKFILVLFCFVVSELHQPNTRIDMVSATQNSL